MGVISNLFGSKPKDYVIRPGEYRELYQEEREGNNPDVVTPWGSTSVTWDGNRATINQSLSPELEGIKDQLLGFVGQGPQQIGNYSNPFLESLLGNVSSSFNRRYGMAAPQVNMGGYSSPQGMQQPALPTVQGPQAPQEAQPALPAPGSYPMAPQEQHGNGAMFGTPAPVAGGGMSYGGLGDMLEQYRMMQNRLPFDDRRGF